MLNEKELMVGTAVFLLLFSIDEKEKSAKIERKSIVRSLKKQLAICRDAMDPKRYIAMVKEASVLLERVKDRMVLRYIPQEKLLMITPYGLLLGLEKVDPVILSKFEFNEKHMKSMERIYGPSNLMFPSVMFANRIMTEVDTALSNVDKVVAGITKSAA